MIDHSDMIKRAVDAVQTRYTRDGEIRQAAGAYPGMEIGAAYKKWKVAHGASASPMITAEQDKLKSAMDQVTSQLRVRPCTRPGCDGHQILEPVCSGCVEGQAGYKVKWTCRKCMHRDLSKEDFNSWMKQLASQLKGSFSPKP